VVALLIDRIKGEPSQEISANPLATLTLSHPDNDVAAIVAVGKRVVDADAKQALATVEAK